MFYLYKGVFRGGMVFCKDMLCLCLSSNAEVKRSTLFPQNIHL